MVGSGCLKMEEPGTQKAALPSKEKFREFTKLLKMTEENMSPLVYLTLFRLYPKSGCLLQVFGTAVPSLYSVLLPIYQMSVSQQILRDDHHEDQVQDTILRHPTNASGLQPSVLPGN